MRKINIPLLVFSPTGTMPQALDTVLNKVCPQRRLIEVKSVEEGDRISPLEGTTAEIERWILQVRQ